MSPWIQLSTEALLNEGTINQTESQQIKLNQILLQR